MNVPLRWDWGNSCDGTTNVWSLHYTTSTSATTFQITAPAVWAPPIEQQPPPPRGFNVYLNAFDLLMEFTKEAHAAGIRRADFVRLPVELFVTWLILKSAEFDGIEPPEGTPRALPFPRRFRCLDCGRFVPAKHRDLQFPYCGVGCVEHRSAMEGRT